MVYRKDKIQLHAFTVWGVIYWWQYLKGGGQSRSLNIWWYPLSFFKYFFFISSSSSKSMFHSFLLFFYTCISLFFFILWGNTGLLEAFPKRSLVQCREASGTSQQTFLENSIPANWWLKRLMVDDFCSIQRSTYATIFLQQWRSKSIHPYTQHCHSGSDHPNSTPSFLLLSWSNYVYINMAMHICHYECKGNSMISLVAGLQNGFHFMLHMASHPTEALQKGSFLSAWLYLLRWTLPLRFMHSVYTSCPFWQSLLLKKEKKERIFSLHQSEKWHHSVFYHFIFSHLFSCHSSIHSCVF